MKLIFVSSKLSSAEGNKVRYCVNFRYEGNRVGDSLDVFFTKVVRPHVNLHLSIFVSGDTCHQVTSLSTMSDAHPPRLVPQIPCNISIISLTPCVAGFSIAVILKIDEVYGTCLSMINFGISILA